MYGRWNNMYAIGCDHGAFELKEEIKKHLESRNISFKDFGTYSKESVDYPDIAKTVCNAVLSKECERGILLCGTGIGISIAANKIKGIRAALCGDCFSAKMAKEHNNANIIALGGRILGSGLATSILDAWIDAEFQGGRHQNRVDKIHKLEK
jgi:ribose 5-phosphate isomerase B